MKRVFWICFFAVIIASVIIIGFSVSANSIDDSEFMSILESKNDNMQNNSHYSPTDATPISGDSVLELYNSIRDAAYDPDTDSFYERYGGAYVSENGRLCLLYCGNYNDFNAWLLANGITVDWTSVDSKKVDKAYDFLYKMKQKLDAQVEAMSVANSRWKGYSYYPMAIKAFWIDDQNNCLHVVYDTEKDKGLESVSPDAFQPTEKLFFIGEEEDKYIEYEYITGSNIERFSTEYLYPGEAIYYRYTRSGITYTSRFSIGLRGQYIGNDGVPYFGFLTVSHGFTTSDNNNVYVKHGSTYYKIGEKKWSVLNDNYGIDAAFVAVSSGYEMKNTVYFTSFFPVSGGVKACDSQTSPSTGAESVYCNYYLSMPNGYAVYTNGSTTGKTSGTIVSFETTVTFDDSTEWYHYGIVTNPFYHGDSGGIVYSNASSTGTFDDYIVVGMVEGGDPDNSLYVISTYARLNYVINNYPTIIGNLTFLTIY